MSDKLVISKKGYNQTVDYPPGCKDKGKCIVASSMGYSFVGHEPNQIWVQFVIEYKTDYALGNNTHRSTMRGEIVRAIEQHGYQFFTLTKTMEWKELTFFEKCEKVRKAVEGQIFKDTIIYPCAKNSILNKNGRLYKRIIDVINTYGAIDKAARPVKFQELIIDYFISNMIENNGTDISLILIEEDPDLIRREYDNDTDATKVIPVLSTIYDKEITTRRKLMYRVNRKTKITSAIASPATITEAVDAKAAAAVAPTADATVAKAPPKPTSKKSAAAMKTTRTTNYNTTTHQPASSYQYPIIGIEQSSAQNNTNKRKRK